MSQPPSDVEVFKKLWLIVFKPLYLVMLLVLALRTVLLFMYDKAESVTLGSVALGLFIATVVIGFVSALIAAPFVKYKKQ